MKHRVTLRSTFDDEGYLKTFKVVNMIPPLTGIVREELLGVKRLAINDAFSLFIEQDEDDEMPILWLLSHYDRPEQYDVFGYISREEYQQALKVWNKAYEDIEVVDVNNKIIGEL